MQIAPLLSNKALARNMTCSKNPFFLQKYNPEYSNMLSICCGLGSVCVFGKDFFELQTDELKGKKNVCVGRGDILVLDSRAVVRKHAIRSRLSLK